MSILDLWLTIFRAEDEMNQILCKGLGHFVRPEKQVSVFPCRFRADVMIAARYPERRSTTSLPWADFRCPYRAIESRLSKPRAALEDELALGWFPLPHSGQRPDVPVFGNRVQTWQLTEFNVDAGTSHHFSKTFTQPRTPSRQVRCLPISNLGLPISNFRSPVASRQSPSSSLKG